MLSMLLLPRVLQSVFLGLFTDGPGGAQSPTAEGPPAPPEGSEGNEGS